MKPRLSIVIPMFNETARIGTGVTTILSYVADAEPSSEALLVDDGSRDGTADAAREVLDRTFPGRGKLIRFERNRGKGAAVRAGMQAAEGDIRLFADADNSTPIEELQRLLPLVDNDRSIVIGSRGLRESIIEFAQPSWRRMMGKTFNLMPRFLLGLPFRDTQCGFKLFGRTAAEVCFARQTLERFAFDVELLWIARSEGFPIREVPVRWINSQRSTVDPIRDSLRMASDVLKIRWRHRRRGL